MTEVRVMNLSTDQSERTSIIRLNEVDLSTKNDLDLIAITERVRDYMMEVETSDLNILRDTRNRELAMSSIMKRAIKSHDAKMEAENNLAEGRLYIEHKMGRLIPEMREMGLLLSQGEKQTYLQDMSALRDYSISNKQSSLYQKVAAIPIEMLADYALTARENNLEITTPGLLRFFAGAPIMTSSEGIEYYTPAPYIEAARHVMGTIDLDPASCTEANEIVKASAFYTTKMNGLSQRWFGNVWLNPPYGTLSGDFGARLTAEYGAGNIKQAVALFNAHITDTQWFSAFWDYPICFTNHRINFLNTDDKSGSTHGSLFVYLGNNISGFIQWFKVFGAIVGRIDNE